MFYYDKKEKIFKQYYVVNKDFEHKKISFTKRRRDIKVTEYVRSLDDFFEEYGEWNGSKGKFYCRKENEDKPWMHHYSDIDALPIEIQP